MNFRTFGNLLRLCVLSGLIVGLCSGQEKQVQKVPEASSTLSSGDALYTQHCALCHGNDLKGNGPFPPPYRVPPDLTTLSRRHGGKSASQGFCRDLPGSRIGHPHLQSSRHTHGPWLQTHPPNPAASGLRNPRQLSTFTNSCAEPIFDP
jgi:hypothetical protein